MDDQLLKTPFAGRYRLISALGDGGMGSVYRAIDETLNRVVAVKVLASRHDAASQPRVAKEARIAARLVHPNILSVFDYGEVEGCTYIVMELVEGSSFADIIQARKPIALESAVAVVAQIGDALQYAHKQDVIHGDIKPANILVSASGRALLSDFGIATAIGGSTRTSAGLVLGTPKYMSPEQAMGRPLDRRSDIYSLAVVLHEALTDVSWISGESAAEMLKRVVEEAPPPIRTRNRHEAAWIEPVLVKALAKNPADRYQTADEFVRDLRRAVRPRSHTLEEASTSSLGLPFGASLLAMPTPRGPTDPATEMVAPYRPPEVAARLTLRDPAAGSWLLVVDGPLNGQQFNLRDVVSIGRSADSVVQLPDSYVSRHHADIVLRDDHFFIVDRGSRFGTLVNGAKIKERELRDRDEIQLGGTTLLFISAVVDPESSGVDSKRRLNEFNTIWQELTRAAHGN